MTTTQPAPLWSGTFWRAFSARMPSYEIHAPRLAMA